MRNRNIITHIFFVLLLSPCMVFALTISDIEVDSAINEALNGEIPFHLSSKEKPSDINVKLLSQDIYKQQNIVWQNVLSTVSFKRVGTSVTFTSNSKVIKPVIDLLVEINSRNDKKIRHYKIVLGHQASNNKIATNLIKTLKSGHTTKKPGIASSNSMTIEESLNARLINDSEIGPINSDDNFSIIAKYLSKRFGVPIKKMQPGLRKINSNAFSDSKLTKLKTGIYLKIPDALIFNASNKPDQEVKKLNSQPRINVKSDDANTGLGVDSNVIESPLVKIPINNSLPIEKINGGVSQLQSRIEQLEKAVNELKNEAHVLSKQEQISVEQILPSQQQLLISTPTNIAPPVVVEKNESVEASNFEKNKLGQTNSIKEQKLLPPKKKSSLYIPLIAVLAFVFLFIVGWIYKKKVRVKSKHARVTAHAGIFDQPYSAVKKSINSTDDFDIIDLELNSTKGFFIDDIDLDLEKTDDLKEREKMASENQIIP
jgi:Tfp pilus assembly protein FimV